MRTLILLLSLLFPAIVSAQGFNLGQAHHRAHQLGFTNGFIPDDSIKAWNQIAPHNFARQSGTMSNSWALDIPGYNHFQHDQQLRNQRIPQPTQSYGYAFIDFVKKWGYDSIIWTLNTHQAFIARENNNEAEARIWEQRMWDFLDLLDKEGIYISHIHLDNEWWMDGRVCGISAGAPNLGDKIRMGGALGILRPNNWFQTPVKAHMNRYLDYLQSLVPSLRKRYPHAKILMTVDHPTHLRGNWMADEVLKRSFYDMIAVHYYPNTRNTRETIQWLNERNTRFRGIPQAVTEWNYHYDSGTPYKGFHIDMENWFNSNPDVKLHLRHTLWYQGSAFSFINP